MIETIYNETSSESSKPNVNIRLPKNIKQIGQSNSSMNYQIYIEENVLFYIKQKSITADELRYGVLLGEKKQGNGYTYVFINGVIEVENIIEHTVIFSDDIWTNVYDNLKRYYKNSDIVGWFVASDNNQQQDLHNIKKLHLDNFAGNGKVYLGINREEGEEAFFVYERNGLRKQPCYHVYFEKAVEFEDYLFGTGYVVGEDVMKKEVKEVGKYGIALNNTKQESDKRPTIKFGRNASYAAIVLLVAVVYYMGSKGQLDSVSDKMKSMVGGIVDGDEKEGRDIVSVNGNLQPTKSSEEIVSSSEESESVTETTPIEEKVSEEITTKREEESTTIAKATVTIPNENYEIYVVKAGDTLYSIALEKYGTSEKIDEIMDLNKLEDEDYVIEGQKIFLP